MLTQLLFLQCSLVHLSTTNPTFINGDTVSSIDTAVLLKDGDSIVFGDRTFIFHEGEQI